MSARTLLRRWWTLPPLRVLIAALVVLVASISCSPTLESSSDASEFDSLEVSFSNVACTLADNPVLVGEATLAINLTCTEAIDGQNKFHMLLTNGDLWSEINNDTVQPGHILPWENDASFRAYHEQDQPFVRIEDAAGKEIAKVEGWFIAGSRDGELIIVHQGDVSPYSEEVTLEHLQLLHVLPNHSLQFLVLDVALGDAKIRSASIAPLEDGAYLLALSSLTSDERNQVDVLDIAEGSVRGHRLFHMEHSVSKINIVADLLLLFSNNGDIHQLQHSADKMFEVPFKQTLLPQMASVSNVSFSASTSLIAWPYVLLPAEEGVAVFEFRSMSPALAFSDYREILYRGNMNLPIEKVAVSGTHKLVGYFDSEGYVRIENLHDAID